MRAGSVPGVGVPAGALADGAFWASVMGTGRRPAPGAPLDGGGGVAQRLRQPGPAPTRGAPRGGHLRVPHSRLGAVIRFAAGLVSPCRHLCSCGMKR